MGSACTGEYTLGLAVLDKNREKPYTDTEIIFTER